MTTTNEEVEVTIECPCGHEAIGRGKNKHEATKNAQTEYSYHAKDCPFATEEDKEEVELG